MITLFLRYTIDPNKLADIAKYSADEQIPIQECGGKILGYFMPTDFAGATNEAIGLIDFPSLAEYEIYRAKLAAHPLHKKHWASFFIIMAVLLLGLVGLLFYLRNQRSDD